MVRVEQSRGHPIIAVYFASCKLIGRMFAKPTNKIWSLFEMGYSIHDSAEMCMWWTEPNWWCPQHYDDPLSCSVVQNKVGKQSKIESSHRSFGLSLARRIHIILTITAVSQRGENLNVRSDHEFFFRWVIPKHKRTLTTSEYNQMDWSFTWRKKSSIVELTFLFQWFQCKLALTFDTSRRPTTRLLPPPSRKDTFFAILFVIVDSIYEITRAWAVPIIVPPQSNAPCSTSLFKAYIPLLIRDSWTNFVNAVLNTLVEHTVVREIATERCGNG